MSEKSEKGIQTDYLTLKKRYRNRIKAAKLSDKNLLWDEVYYLAGSSVELALKAYYCKQMFFPPRKTDELYKHDLNVLLTACGLRVKFDEDGAQNTKLTGAWGVVKEWSEEDKYILRKENEAKAILEGADVILKWIEGL